MEKFSTWRDPSTGLAPFVSPLPPLSAFQLPTLLWIPLLPLALFRTLCLLVLAAVFVSVDGLARVLSIFSVRFHAAFQYYCTALFARIALHLLGFTTLPSDPPFSHRTSSQKLISTPVQPGDVVVCNWSSYVDVIYLGYLYNPIFILPVFLKDGQGGEQGATDPVALGFERKSLVQLVARTGHPPTTTTTNKPTTQNIKSLAEFLDDSRRLQRPIVVFPEGTTSNNRALLKCPRLSEGGVGNLGGEVRMFCMAIKHEAATGLKRSITVPIPSVLGSAGQMVEANGVPVLMAGMLSPRSLLVRFPRPADMLLLLDPQSLSPHIIQLAFRNAFDRIAAAAKLKITNHISALHKAAFLNYARHRK